MPESQDGSPSASTPTREGRPASFWRDAGAAFTFVFRSPLAIFLFYGLAFVISFTAFYGADLQAAAYLHSRPTHLWRLLSTLAPTVWVLILVIVLGDFASYRSAWPPTRKGRMVIAFCIILGMPFVALPLLAQYTVWQKDPVVHDAISHALPISNTLTKANILNLVGLVSGTLLCSGMMGVHIQLINRLPAFRHRAEQPESGGLEEDVRWYQLRQTQLRGFLTLLGVLMGATILSVSAMRHLINEAISDPTARLPTASILGFGVYHTGLLASIYLPTHNALKNVGQTLAERIVRQSLEASVTCKQRYEEREAARTWLGLQGSPLQEFQQAFSILTPLLASISALILGPAT